MVIFVEVVSTRFSQEVKARKRKKEVTINGKAILYLFWFVSNMRRFQVNSTFLVTCKKAPFKVVNQQVST